VLRTRLVTALVALPLLAAAILHPYHPVFAGLVVAACATAAYEFFVMALPGRRGARAVGLCLVMLVAAGVAARRPDFWGPALAGAVIIGMIFCLFDADEMTPAVTRAAFLVLGVVYAGFLLSHFVPLKRLPGGPQWVIFTVVVVMASDSGGYFIGRVLGRHRLVPRISPNKTVEGAAGSLVVALLVASLARVTFFPVLTWREIGGLGVTFSVLGQLGDLTESMFKRAFGAKDSGWIIPGHGGMLDRVDSLVFPAVVAYYYAALAHG
jgi:phosphatidate cytidylyltransferase